MRRLFTPEFHGRMAALAARDITAMQLVHVMMIHRTEADEVHLSAEDLAQETGEPSHRVQEALDLLVEDHWITGIEGGWKFEAAQIAGGTTALW